jgi:hypothetical protein
LVVSYKNGDIFGHTISVFYDQDGKLKYITNIGDPNMETLFKIFGSFDNLGQVIASEEARTGWQIFLHGFTYLGSVGEQMDPQSFEEALSQLSTPSKILNYMTRNFQFNSNSTCPTQSPQQLFQTREGNKFDFAVFISYLLDQNSYETEMLRLEFTENDIVKGYDIIVVYWDVDNYLKSITHHGEQVMRESQAYSSLDDLIRHEEDARSLSSSSEIRVFRYGFLAPGTTNLMPIEWTLFSSD